MIICYLDYDIKSSFKELAFVIVPLSSVFCYFRVLPRSRSGRLVEKRFPRLGVFCAANWGLIASMPACFVIYYKHARYGKRVSRVLVDLGRRRCSRRVTPTYECITDKEYWTTKAIFYVQYGEITAAG